MFAWLRRALTPVQSSQPRLGLRLTEVENAVEELLSRMDQLAGELRRIRGRQFAMEKKTLQDDSGETIDERPAPDDVAPRARPVAPTAFLSRRFKGY